MGNKLSKKNHDEKQTLKRFDSIFKKVNSYIEEAKQSEEEMDFEEASSLYMHALKLVYTFIDESKVPDQVGQEIATLVVDMIKKREELKEYKKMYDIAKQSYKEDNQRFQEEDRQAENEGEHVEAAANERADDISLDDDGDEQQELRLTWEEMAAVFHCNEEKKKQILWKKMNSRQRYELECQILNKKAEEEEDGSENGEGAHAEDHEDDEDDKDDEDDEDAEDDEDDEDDEDAEDDDDVEYQEEDIHFTDKIDVKIAMTDIENRVKISKDNFENDSEYILALTQMMLKDTNIKGITVDQLIPLVNRIVWERGMEQKKTEKNVKKIIKNMKAACDEEINNLKKDSKTCKKENDTQKEMKEIYDALNAKLQKPGRDIKDCVTFNSIIGLHAVKRALDTGIQVPLQRPELVASGDIQHYEGLLLFGPPGTGKSMIAKALANEAQNCSFIQVDRADLVSKWQGQSEKIVNTLFKIARQNKPCIVFVDEIEGLMEDRDGGEGSSNGSKVVTVLLTAMQNLGRDQVFVLGASNYPWKLDKAFYRRFSQIVYVPLPNFGERVKIFKANIFKNEITTSKQITHADIEQLALLTEQYSGSHISRVVAAALAICYQRVSKIKYFKRSIKGKNYWQPCTKEEEGAKRMSIKQAPKIVMPPLLMEDLEMALFEIKNNVEAGYLKKLVKWGEQNSNMTE